MPDGKYFYIKSKLNGLVLDVKGASREPNTLVITWAQKPREDGDNQLWYEDHLKGVIRSKQTDLCLDITDDTNQLVTNCYDSKRDSQQWMTAGDRVQNRKDPERVLDITSKRTWSGAKICSWKPHGELNQQWTFEYQPPRYFYLRSVVNGKVMDIKGRKREVGAKVVIMDREDPDVDSQLWYEDKHGMICSKVHGYVFDTSDDNRLRLQPFEPGNNKQLWAFGDSSIINITQPNMALDIKGDQDKNGAKVLAYKWHGNLKNNQQWTMLYV